MSVKITVTSNVDLEQLVKDHIAKLGTDIYGELVMATAVDTGALRQDWQYDQNAPNPTITNNKPYAMKVMEDGHSDQTPPGTLTTIIDKYSDH